MDTMAATEFKQKCLSVIDHLGPNGVLITKHGKPVAKIIPVEASGAELLGSLAGKIRITGDLLSTSLEWDAES